MNLIYQFRKQNHLSQQDFIEKINEEAKKTYGYAFEFDVKQQNLSVWENNRVEAIKMPFIEPIICKIIGVEPGEVNKNLASLYKKQKEKLNG